MSRELKKTGPETPETCETEAPPEFAAGASCPVEGNGDDGTGYNSADGIPSGKAGVKNRNPETGKTDDKDAENLNKQLRDSREEPYMPGKMAARHDKTQGSHSETTAQDRTQSSSSPDTPNSRNNDPGAASSPDTTDTSNGPAAPETAHGGKITWQLFWSFLKIGVFTFGGGYAMIPLIQREVTGKRKWVEPSKFLELFTLAQSAPGPISLNTAVFVGYNLNRYKGAAAAILGSILPSFVILLLIAVYFADIKDNHVVEAVFKGMRPAVVALIVAPLVGFTKGMGLYRIGIAVLVAAAIWRLGVSPALCILLGAAGGVIWVYFSKRKEARK